jgi:uncharacterized coiled-coil protein SlyX
LRVIDVNHPAAQTLAQEGGGALEEAEEAGKAGGKAGRWSKVGKFATSAAGKFNKFGLPGLTIASTVADSVMDDKNPAKKTVTSALSGASTGMAIGEMAAPLLAMTGFGAVLAPFAPMIGAGIGAAVGGIMANWDSIKGAVVNGFKVVTDTVGSILNWFGGIIKYTPLGMIVDLVQAFSKGGFTGVFDTIKKSFSSAFDGIESVFKNVFGFIGDKLSWLSNLDLWGMVRKFLPKSLSDAIDVLVGNKSAVTTGPNDQNTDISKLKLEVSQMENTIATLRTQLATTQKDNATMHKQLATLIEKIEHGNNQSAALLGANLDATKKGNQIMSDPLTGR